MANIMNDGLIRPLTAEEFKKEENASEAWDDWWTTWIKELSCMNASWFQGEKNNTEDTAPDRPPSWVGRHVRLRDWPESASSELCQQGEIGNKIILSIRESPKVQQEANTPQTDGTSPPLHEIAPVDAQQGDAPTLDTTQQALSPQSFSPTAKSPTSPMEYPLVDPAHLSPSSPAAAHTYPSQGSAQRELFPAVLQAPVHATASTSHEQSASDLSGVLASVGAGDDVVGAGVVGAGVVGAGVVGAGVVGAGVVGAGVVGAGVVDDSAATEVFDIPLTPPVRHVPESPSSVHM